MPQESIACSPAVLTFGPNNRPRLREALAAPGLLVVSLCAAWCDTCTSFQATLEGIAIQRPETNFIWLDIEDDTELAGDIDVVNFPTLAIYRAGRLLHYGVCLPLDGVVTRLLDAMALQSSVVVADDIHVLELPQRLQNFAG